MEFSRDVRNILTSSEYRAIFPNTNLAADSSAKDRWHTAAGGGYVAAGVGSALTGHGADILVIDDPVKNRADAESETIRKAVWDWYSSTAHTRLLPGGAIIVIQTRWQEEDLAGKLLAAEESGDGERWEKLIFPVFNEDMSALWPEAYPVETLNELRKPGVTHPYDWAALYEQRPRPVEGGYFALENFLVGGQPVEVPRLCDFVFAVVDSAVKTGKDNDGTAVEYFARCTHDGVAPPLTILDWDLRQMEGATLEVWLPGVLSRLEELSRLCRSRMGSFGVWIEDKASGSILLQQGSNRGWPVHPIATRLTAMGKSERAIDVSGYIHRGAVKIAREAFEKTLIYKGISRNHLLAQLLSFHVGTKDMVDDDLLDTNSYGVAIGMGNAEGF